MNAFIYEWHIVFRESRMGFAKTFRVMAEDYARALISARDELQDAGYEPERFEPTEIRRGTMHRNLNR